MLEMKARRTTMTGASLQQRSGLERSASAREVALPATYGSEKRGRIGARQAVTQNERLSRRRCLMGERNDRPADVVGRWLLHPACEERKLAEVG